MFIALYWRVFSPVTLTKSQEVGMCRALAQNPGKGLPKCGEIARPEACHHLGKRRAPGYLTEILPVRLSVTWQATRTLMYVRWHHISTLD